MPSNPSCGFLSWPACRGHAAPRLQIFVMSSHRIQQRGYDTLFKYTTANPKSAISIFVKKFPAKLQVGLRTSVHILPGAWVP